MIYYKDRQPNAIFSDCGKFRFWLEWPTGLDNDRAMLMCGANPSQAGKLEPDGTRKSDPTISRMRGLARELGYGWLWAVNARSYIATDPRDVPPDPEAIGNETDMYIRDASRRADLVVVCYGHLAGERGPVVLQMIRDSGKVPHALALTGDGKPRHPRGLPKSVRPFPLEVP